MRWSYLKNEGEGGKQCRGCGGTAHTQTGGVGGKEGLRLCDLIASFQFAKYVGSWEPKPESFRRKEGAASRKVAPASSVITEFEIAHAGISMH